mgnify:CR=1 FL=1
MFKTFHSVESVGKPELGLTETPFLTFAFLTKVLISFILVLVAIGILAYIGHHILNLMVDKIILKLETDIRSTYTGTGSNTTFFLAQQVDPDEVEVYVDDVLKTEFGSAHTSLRLILSVSLLP